MTRLSWSCESVGTRVLFLPPDALDWPLNAVLVRSGGQTILIEEGLGSDPNLDLPRAGQLIRRLDAAGIDLASVTDVVLTHMHTDPIGGLLVDEVKAQLPSDLRIHVAAAEVAFWQAPAFSLTAMPPGSPTRFGPPPHGSWPRMATTCGHSRMRTRWSSIAPAATPRDTAWSAWRPGATA